MSSNDLLTIISEKFKNGENGEQVDGLTVIIDGKIKQIFDKILLEKGYNDYSEVLSDVIFNGINKMLEK
ncbi:hypothetical protein [Defluviitalea phaphyphila]|uniref:hypothetical protein n=1 Tax=Defluviitalea phaphyphila TaxID=1473580 RepID=UPI000730BE6E|nr:hypothetical protein [Defluviitalea phaphyphila]